MIKITNKIVIDYIINNDIFIRSKHKINVNKINIDFKRNMINIYRENNHSVASYYLPSHEFIIENLLNNIQNLI